jgi:hypothetical protein
MPYNFDSESADEEASKRNGNSCLEYLINAKKINLR